MDGWMDGWMAEWLTGWTDGWIDGWVGGWVDGWVDIIEFQTDIDENTWGYTVNDQWKQRNRETEIQVDRTDKRTQMEREQND